MSERDAETPTPARPPSPPASARPVARASDEQRRGTVSPRSGGRKQRPSGERPTPARVLDDSGSSDDVPVEQMRFRRDETEWVVRVRGRSGGGVGSTPLLLLGFWAVPAGSVDGEDGAVPGLDADAVPEREALVVGTSLVQCGEEGLANALAGSTPPSPPPNRQSAERPARPRRRGRGRR